MMKEIPTAKKLIKEEDSISYGFNYEKTTAIDSRVVKKLMIEFAKLHLEAQREAIKEKAKIKSEYKGHGGEFEDIPIYDYSLDKQSIDDAYPLNLIK